MCFALGTPQIVRERRPEYAALFRTVGWVWFVVLSSVAQHAWYDDIGRNQHIFYHAGLAVAAAAGLFLAWLLPTQLPHATLRARLTLGGALAFATVSSVLPGAFHRDDVAALGVISFIALWIGFALAAHQLGRIWLLNIARPCFSASAMSAIMRRSPRSSAMSAPASSVMPGLGETARVLPMRHHSMWVPQIVRRGHATPRRVIRPAHAPREPVQCTQKRSGLVPRGPRAVCEPPAPAAR